MATREMERGEKAFQDAIFNAREGVKELTDPRIQSDEAQSLTLLLKTLNHIDRAREMHETLIHLAFSEGMAER